MFNKKYDILLWKTFITVVDVFYVISKCDTAAPFLQVLKP